MHRVAKDHLFILPHADEYRQFYGISIDDVLTCLNHPDTHAGLATDHYTAEKAMHDQHIYVYYYLTLPLQATDKEVFAIVDFIGYTGAADVPSRTQ